MTATRQKRPITVTVQVQLSLAEAAALVAAPFTCTSAAHWREAQLALAAVKSATARRLEGRS